MERNFVTLDGGWLLQRPGQADLPATVPGSLYASLLVAGEMPDPYWGENQYPALELSRQGCSFATHFTPNPGLLGSDRVYLRFEGVDTVADIYLNGRLLGHTENMHRSWEYEVSALLLAGENTLRVDFASPLAYIEKRQAEDPLWGVESTVPGYNHLRKAHYMFGWDWGPKLPDMGLWRPVTLTGHNAARFTDLWVRQRHAAGAVQLHIQPAFEAFGGQACTVQVRVRCPGGQVLEGEGTGAVMLDVPEPQLWWPNGYGGQPLYTVEATLLCEGRPVDRRSLRTGLRTVTVSREPDAWGEEFCFVVNGLKIFAMGADYIPEDQIIPFGNTEKTRHLLRQCRDANFNHVRVWGGGYYPGDDFYDACDELGLLVWQDFMFACAVYRMTPEFSANVRAELAENVRRLRHHPSLALWCGNNEMEDGLLTWVRPALEAAAQQRGEDFAAAFEATKQEYLALYEQLIPEVLATCDPDTFYWPSSPSSGGGFDEPQSPDRGDVHYWAVWHGLKPLTEFRKYYFRFCSEYGFCSLPSVKTVRAFAEEQDMNLFSAVMEAHDKCTDGTLKLLYYMSEVVPYPYSFEGVVYATQLLQADAIRANVEHMRRNRGRCMGSTYWQMNDSNPVISWASIDYFGRWKALHYYARRFYAPVLLSVDDTDAAALRFNVSNETAGTLAGTLRWALRDAGAAVLKSGSAPVTAAAFAAVDCLTLNLSAQLADKAAQRGRYLTYSLECGGETVSGGTSLFVQPKHFAFRNPQVRVDVREEGEAFVLRLSAAAYAKSVCLDLEDWDCVFSDNWFDIHGGEPVEVRVEKGSVTSPAVSLTAFEAQLKVFTCHDLLAR